MASAAALAAPEPMAAAAAGQPGSGASDPRLGLTVQETEWLRAHPRLRVFIKATWVPIDLYAYEGQFRGLSGDYLRQIERQLGVRFEFQVGDSVSDGRRALAEGRADIVPAVSRMPRGDALMDLTRPYLDVHTVYVARRDESGVGPQATMKGLRVAVESGYAAAELVRESHPQAQLVEVADSVEALRAVSDGSADVYLGALSTAAFLVDKLMLTNLDTKGMVRPDFSSLHLGVRKGEDTLRAVLDKALGAIPAFERDEIRRRWAPQYSLLGAPAAEPLVLTEAERRLVRTMAPLRIGYEADYQPYSFVGDDGRLSGMANDLLLLIAAKTGLPLATPEPGIWAEVLRRARGGEFDLLIAAARNEERERDFDFVGPWISSPNVLLTRTDADPVFSLEQLEGRRVAVLRDGATAHLLRRLYPQLSLLEVPARDDVLAAVTNGQADAGFGSAARVAPKLAHGLGRVLKMAGFFPELNSNLYFAVRRDQVVLAGLLRRAMASITEAERGAIAARWATLPVNLDAEVHLRNWLRRLLPLMAGLAMVLLASLIWGWRLRGEIRRRRATEAALATERDRANELARARQDFLEHASHEIRTPVNAVIGALGQLQSQALPTAAREMTQLARGSAQTLSEFVNNLLDLSKSDAGALRLVLQADSLPATLRAALRTIEPAAQAVGVTVRSWFDPQLAPAHVIDAFRLQQVVLNLLSNAVKFGQGQPVWLNARVLDGTNDRQRVCIEIEDQGLGIESATAERLFQRFAQAGDSLTHRRDGSGLGLALCKRLVEAMGGAITIAPRMPRGTCASVTLDLPVAQPAAAFAVADDGMPHVAPDAPRVLVVEDDRVQQILLETLLRGQGCEVDVAGSAEAAQPIWLQHRHPMVVTDIRLPGQDGCDLARWLREQEDGAQVRVIGCSADLDITPRALAAGIDRMVSKPVTPDAIAGMVASLSASIEAQDLPSRRES